jgi:hypothetical protein
VSVLGPVRRHDAWCVMEAEHHVWLGEADPQAGDQISTVSRPPISLKGPVKVPQKEQGSPTPHPRCSN